jgi:hypothetical protein
MNDEAARQDRPATSTQFPPILAPRAVVMIGIEAHPVAYLDALNSTEEARVTHELCQPGCDERILAAVAELRETLLERLKGFAPGDVWGRAA